MSVFRLLEGVPLAEGHRRWLNEVSHDIRLPFVKMIDAMAALHGKDMDWWVSEIASRNTNTSLLFTTCCQAVFLKRVLEREAQVTEIEVDSPVLAHVMRVHSLQTGRPVRVTCSVPWWKGARKRGGVILTHLKGWAHLGTSWLVSRVIPPVGPFSEKRSLTLLDTFVFDDSFSRGSYQDRYYSGFSEFLSEDERGAVFYVPTFATSFRRTIGAIKAVRQAPSRFILKEDFLKIKDYLYAFLYPVRALKLFPGRVCFEGLDMTRLLRRTWAAHLFSPSSIEGLLKYRFARQLKKQGVSLRLVIDWFENQVIDKGANAGIRRFYPETPLVGYQGFIVPKHYLCMYPTVKEAENAVIPQAVAVCGRGFVTERKEFCPSLDVFAAPAFRFAGVWRERRQHPDAGHFTVLIGLPLEEEWREVLKRTVDVSSGPLPPHTRFWLKVHPAAGSVDRVLRRAGTRVPSSFEIVQGAFTDIVEKVDVVIGNTSSTCLESLAKGVPVVVVGNGSGLTQNPIPEEIDQDLWRLCDTTDEIRTALWEFAERSDSEKKRHESLSKKIRDTYFEPVTREGVRKFLRLEHP